MNRLADLEILDRDLDVLRNVGRLGGNGQRHELLVEEAVGDQVAGNDQRDVDGDLLAAANQDQVDVLDGATDGVALDGLREREFVAAFETLERSTLADLSARLSSWPEGSRGAAACRGHRGQQAPCAHGVRGERHPCRTLNAPRRRY